MLALAIYFRGCHHEQKNASNRHSTPARPETQARCPAKQRLQRLRFHSPLAGTQPFVGRLVGRGAPHLGTDCAR
ncbi:MAG: hypothetical protein OJF50_006272 [Nitrospira sp.]|nr:hypothetical protein [Nitrospira sp.]